MIGKGLSFDRPRRNLSDKVDLDALARNDPEIRAFLFWARMPVVEREGAAMYRLYDQRFAGQIMASRFSLVFPVMR